MDTSGLNGGQSLEKDCGEAFYYIVQIHIDTVSL